MDANVILKYKREEDRWVCPECDTENSVERGKCHLCGFIRTEGVAYKRAWSPEDEAREKRVQSGGFGNGQYNGQTAGYASRVSTPVENPVYGGADFSPAPAKKSHKGLVIGIIAAAVVVVIIAVALMLGSAGKDRTYNDAVTYYNRGNYSKALDKFEQLPDDYKDVAYMKKDTMYMLALEYLYDDGDPDAARDLFEELGNYEDSQAMLVECDYVAAKNLLEEGSYNEAKNAFYELDGYYDSDDMIKECDYRKATDFYNSGEYTEAMKIFNFLGYYSDSDDMFDKAETALINENMNNYRYTTEEDMIGEWRNSDGDYAIYSYNDDGTVHVSYNLPYTSGTYFKIENGVHYHGNYSWYKQWIFEYMDDDLVNVYNYKDGNIYVLIKQ